MQKLLICLAALFGASAALAQNLPSPVFKNLTVNGAITAPEFPNLSSNVEGTGVPGLDGGHWFVWNQPGSFDSQETFRVDRHMNSGTGLTGNTYKALSVFSTGNPANAGYEWTFLSNQFNTANASTGSQNVSTAAYMFKKPPTNTMPTVGASGTGSVATILFAGATPIPVGYTVQVAGMTPTAYNGVYKVTASSAGSVSFASTATGAQTVAGTVLNTSVGASWGLNASCEDDTVDFDPIAGCLGAEIDVSATTATTDANRQRVGLQIAAGGPTGSHIGRGLLMGTNGATFIDRGFEINGAYMLGLDFSGSTFTTAPVFLAGGQKVVFDGTAAGTYSWALSDISGTMALRYGATNGMTLDSSGNLNATGSIASSASIAAAGSVTASDLYGNSGSALNINSASGQILGIGAGSNPWVFDTSNYFRPTTDNTLQVGAAGQRVGAGYFTSLGSSGTPIATEYIGTLNFGGTWTEFNSAGTMALQYGGANRLTLDNTGNLNTAGSLSSSGQLSVAGYMKGQVVWSTGTVPTPTGTCAINTQLGGNTAGSFKANGACASGTIILAMWATATNGYACTASDLTTPANAIKQTAYSTTSATFAATMAASDLVTFNCVAF